MVTHPPAPFPCQGKGEYRLREGQSPSLESVLFEISEPMSGVSKRGASPSHSIFPLSFKGEGDQGGEVDQNRLYNNLDRCGKIITCRGV